ncbi:SPOR domain-containing protein [Alteromonas oceanisediminis]|uniref:SPOR domain-containing protein n=1 Tax=Alteromonas oceanisediminis TaxID=2836180 RepID=UPI001BDAC839|nr:SPOR domain-containing protein [Alteromonas oceanisediminis]MBT0586098.1 SPOR domain-containing protein [Alteromonas oceanisediminis]
MNAVYSELHSRLNHLVNYSSQLIFVSSNTISEQQRTLEAFIAEQDEHTEVAYICAEPHEPLQSYRRQLCRQLIGQIAGSFVRPLNELLVTLNHHDGPVLIGITQAQNLPNEFLQELWDLVLQSRFASNKQHLNIVLLGQSAWAEQAQSWLPAENTATPLLLSSESVQAPSTELDQLIAQKRAAFQSRIAKRQQSTPVEADVALIRRPWFSGLVICLFLASFSALLAWQYPDKMRDLLGFTAVEPSDSSGHVSQPEPTAPSVSVEPEVAPSVEEPSEPLTESLLVTRWGESTDARETLTEREAGFTSAEPQQADTSVDAAPPSEQPLETSTVPVSQPLNTEQSPSNGASEPVPTTQMVEEPTLPALPQLEQNQFVIQIAGMQNIELAREFLSDNELLDKVWVYQTQRYGGDWWVLVFNQRFNSLADARSAISNLPAYNQESAPFVKSAQQIARERP